jgi:hypothetical protein
MTHLAVYFPGGTLPGADPFTELLAWITTAEAIVRFAGRA